ncbi:MAG: KTSC domain-containing protein [Chthoniobacterales bacterium]
MAIIRSRVAGSIVLVMLGWSAPVLPAAEPGPVISHIRREPLASTALATAGYSRRLRILEVEFCNGAIYRYLDVPADVYSAFRSSESKTQFYDWNIKGRYRSLRVRGSGHSVARK